MFEKARGKLGSAARKSARAVTPHNPTNSRHTEALDQIYKTARAAYAGVGRIYDLYLVAQPPIRRPWYVYEGATILKHLRDTALAITQRRQDKKSRRTDLSTAQVLRRALDGLAGIKKACEYTVEQLDTRQVLPSVRLDPQSLRAAYASLIDSLVALHAIISNYWEGAL